jgi:hypothetical protein
MHHACQSVATLQQLLAEAADIAAPLAGSLSGELAKRIELAKLSLSEGPIASADVEHEVLSVWELARVERRHSH